MRCEVSKKYETDNEIWLKLNEENLRSKMQFIQDLRCFK